MVMTFNCPHCKHAIDFREIQAESDLAAVIKLITALGPHAKLALAYVDLFHANPMHAKMKKIALLLFEVKGFFDAREFSWKKKQYPISAAGIAEALNIVVKRDFQTVLTNHNYLKSVMVSISEREAKAASIQGERDLRHREAEAAHAYHHIDESTRQGNMKRVGEIIKGIG